MTPAVSLAEILNRVDPRFREDIQRVKRRFRQSIATNLSNAMRLRLQDGGKKTSVRVDVVPGYPKVLSTFRHDAWDEKAEHLIMIRSVMECFLSDSEHILAHIKQLPTSCEDEQRAVQSWIDIPGRSKDLVEPILSYAKARSIIGKILAIDEDILGTYSYEDGQGRVRLYWTVIAFTALSLGVEPTDLALVVLTHELAHAFTHLGHDADGHIWPAFFMSDRQVAEALAQYYTHILVLSIDLKGRETGIRKAYEKLTPLQSPTYRRHLEWVSHWNPEAIRAAMLEHRNGTQGDRDEFEARISYHAERLTSGFSSF